MRKFAIFTPEAAAAAAAAAESRRNRAELVRQTRAQFR